MTFHRNLWLFFKAHRQEIHFIFWFLMILTVLNSIYYFFAGTSVENFHPYGYDR